MLDEIKRRMELARELPETFGAGNSAADCWLNDVTMLLAEVEQQRGDLERLSDHYQRLMRECDEKDAVIERQRSVFRTIHDVDNALHQRLNPRCAACDAFGVRPAH